MLKAKRAAKQEMAPLGVTIIPREAKHPNELPGAWAKQPKPGTRIDPGKPEVQGAGEG